MRALAGSIAAQYEVLRKNGYSPSAAFKVSLPVKKRALLFHQTANRIIKKN
ncbi:hypothetical protein [Silvanigrella aquatica]|uniref:hypothetical protein n=1 Tax=Silvanigrella aquatica TaxID=1915309 RepID=UPI000ACAB015